MDQISRLHISRKNGQSFLIGDHTTVTLFRQPRSQLITAEIQQKNGKRRRVNIQMGKTFYPCPDVAISVTPDGNRGSSLRVTIEAPRSIKILRSELVGREYAPRAVSL